MAGGTPIASSSSDSERGNAFDDNLENLWGGRPDDRGDIWIGLDFGVRVDVQCAVFIDGSSSDDSDERKSMKVKLQKQMRRGSSWIDVLSFDQGIHPMPLDSTTTSKKWRVFVSGDK